jgi:hypothetical protein
VISAVEKPSLRRPLAISLLLNWMEIGALLAILFHLSGTLDLMASTHNAS